MMKFNKYSLVSILLVLSTATTNAFVPATTTGFGNRPGQTQQQQNGERHQQQQYATQRQISLQSSAAATAPSSTSMPPLAPLTLWGEEASDIRSLQAEMRQVPLPEFAIEISSTKDLNFNGNPDAELAYLQTNAMEIKQKMQDHGAVIFRDFTLMKSQDGFEQFYTAVGMKPCLDPLHSVSARPTIDGSKNSPVYEAVNKESRKNFFIGMHNEFVGTRAPRAAAFVCFKAADVGGEFLLADGRRVFRDVDTDLLAELYTRQIRYSVMELPFFNWMKNVPGPIATPLGGLIQGLVSTAINAKVDFNVDLQWQQEGQYADNEDAQSRFLQARAPKQPPVVIHPVTKDPTWFCNVHSHSSKLRRDREQMYGAERFEDGASRINKSDMYFGDDSPLTEEQLQHLDDVTTKNMKYVKMREGDVVLLDNYKTMHGRNVFDGTRKHGVCWFEGWTGEEEMMAKNSKTSTTTKASSSTPFFATSA